MKDSNYFNRIHDDHIDLNTRSIILYSDADSYLYYDEGCTEKIDKDTLRELWLKNMLVVKLYDEDTYVRPSTMCGFDGEATVCVEISGLGEETLVITFKSKEIQ